MGSLMMPSVEDPRLTPGHRKRLQTIVSDVVQTEIAIQQNTAELDQIFASKAPKKPTQMCLLYVYTFFQYRRSF